MLFSAQRHLRAPDPYEHGDVNVSGAVDIDDVVYLIQYIFAGGPAPCEGA